MLGGMHPDKERFSLQASEFVENKEIKIKLKNF